MSVNTADLIEHPARCANCYPVVRGRCPACGLESLFLGAGGYITCAYLPCPDPSAAADELLRPAP